MWLRRCVLAVVCLVVAAAPLGAQPETNRWVEIRRDANGARRSSAIRYVPDERAFFLWGFMNDNPDLLQEHPLIEIPEYDMVSFDPDAGRWQNHFPTAWEELWSKKLPLAYVPRTYSGITNGSERSILRSPTDSPGAASRPDLNLVFDQVAYHPPSKSLIYFTGGLTAAYDVTNRRWTDLAPAHSPPPVRGGSLTYDPVNDEMVLFAGGHVVEPGPNGAVVGYAGTWVYSFASDDWRKLEGPQPPPRMDTRLVLDSKNNVLVVFAGDGQSHYLADTWIYDTRTRTWRTSKATGGPPPRAGHFTVYDEPSGWVIVGGGYNHQDLTDMWAYDPGEDRWRQLNGTVPTGFYLTADIDTARREIYLVTNTKTPGDTTGCNELFPVRTTYRYQLQAEAALHDDQTISRHQPMSKRSPHASTDDPAADAERSQQQAARLRDLPVNEWVHLAEPGRVALTRTWGSATLDTDRGRILSWGGGHCGYGGNDVDAYDIAGHTWRAGDPEPDYPERAWNKGVRESGVTFAGEPWMTHGRRVFAYDPASRKMIVTRPIQLTMGYDPEPLRGFAENREPRAAALVGTPTSYKKYPTWSYDVDTFRWSLLGSAPAGVDTLVSTPHGVMGVNVDWPSRLNDSGYNLPWRPDEPEKDNAVYLLDAAARTWERLGEPQPSPQNLYEFTALAYDTHRDQLILHGGGENRDELWAFGFEQRRWRKLDPVVIPSGAQPPSASREAVYIPRDDVFVTYGRTEDSRSAPVLWAYHLGTNEWRRVDVSSPPDVDPRIAAGQNRALVYDEKRDVLLLVLGTRGDDGQAHVFAMRYRHPPTR